MGIGNARMNILTVGKAATGLSRHLPAPSRILIGYDHRHNSRAFAEISVRIFEGAGHVVDLFPRPVPTPFVPCGMRAACSNDSSGSYYALGIMVTASHNPRQDNGYKVYNERGAQILDSAAAAIAAEISKVTALPPLPPAKATGSAELLERVTDWYNERLGDWLSCLPEPDASLSAPRIVYTPMHGVGGRYVMEVVSRQFPSFGKSNVSFCLI